MKLNQLQVEVAEWANRNFPNNKPYHCLLGAVEEIGELSHAHLKAEQNIRGTPEEHTEAKKDAIADTIIYLCDYCNRSGFDLNEIIIQVWSQVKLRDWTKNNKDGSSCD